MLRNCLLEHAIEGNIEEAERRGRRRKQLPLYLETEGRSTRSLGELAFHEAIDLS